MGFPHLSLRGRRSKKLFDTTENPEKTSFASTLLGIPEKCRRYSLTLIRGRDKPKQHDGKDGHYKPSLNTINIPSHKLFESRENILRDFPFSTRGSRENTPETPSNPNGHNTPIYPATPATPPAASPALSSTPTITPHHHPPTLLTPTKPILKPHGPSPSSHASPADTRANTTRNALLTSNGSPRPTTLKHRLVNARRRCNSLPALSVLPAVLDQDVLRGGVERGDDGMRVRLGFARDKEGEEDKEIPRRETVTLEPLRESESRPGTPTPSSNGMRRKSVRFDRVEINTYHAPEFRRSGKGKGGKKKKKKKKRNAKREDQATRERSSGEEVRRAREAWERRRHSTGCEGMGYR